MNSKPKKHPAYGTVQFNRTESSGSKLFGSPMRDHSTVIRLTIREADLYHDYHEDRIYGAKEIIQVALSSAQFAALLTTMNVGTGIPCTIQRRMGIGMVEELPKTEKIETDRSQESFKKSMDKFKLWLNKKREELEEVLNKKAINNKTRNTVINIIDKVIEELYYNQPFALEQFNKVASRVVTAAQAEIDAFVTQVVSTTGLEQLNSMKNSSIEVKSLGEKKDE